MPDENELSKLIAEKDKIISQIASLQGELRGFERAISILNPSAEKPKRTRRGSLKDIVISYAKEMLATGITADEIVRRAHSEGTDLNKISVSSFLSKNKDIFTLLDGRYHLKV